MKKVLSVILSLLTAVSAFAAAPVYAGAADMHSVREPDSDLAVESESSVGAILGAAVEENESADIPSESITGITVEGRTAFVTLMHTKPCMVAVGIYDETSDELIQTAVMRDISADDEAAALTFENGLPEYFYLRAFILDENCAPLGKQYETSRYTKAYEEFLEKTAADFPQENVINFDDSQSNNFAVFDGSVKEVSAGGGQITETDCGCVFSNADESVKNLREGDIFYYDNNGETEIVKVGAITVSGDTVTITSADAEMEEVFDYVKIDVTAYEAEPDMSEADEGVTLVESDEENEPVGAYEMDCELSRNFTFDIARAMKVGGIEINGAKAELDITTTMHFRLYYSDSVLETELSDGIEGELDVELGVSAKFTINLPRLTFPTPVAGLTIAVKPAFETEISAAFHGKVDFDAKLGFKYNSENGFTNTSQKPRLDAEVNFEGKIYVGFKLTPSIQAAFGVVEIGVEISVGAEGTGTRALTSTDTKDSEHMCRWCIDGVINGKVTIEAELAAGLWKKFSWTASSKLLDWEKELFDFYCSSDLGFGKGLCPNRQGTEPPAGDEPYKRMDLEYNEKAYNANYVVSGDRKHIDVYITGSGNVSDSNYFGLGNFVDDFNAEVSQKAESLYPYDWEKQREYFYAHGIWGNYTNSLYISGFNAVNATTSEETDVHISGPTKVVSLDKCKSISLPDSVEELYIFSIQDTSSFRLPPNIRYIGGFYSCDFTQLTIPSSAEYVEGFGSCPISRLTIMPPEKHLTLSGFWQCPIEDLVIPQGVSLYHFYPERSAMSSIAIQTDTYALLRFCSELEEARFISPLETVGAECCNNCKNLKRVSFEPSVTRIGNMAFYDSGLESVTVPGSVKEIGSSAFYNCDELREIIIEDGVKQIDYQAFAECHNLERVVLPASLSYLDSTAFAGCPQGIELDFCGEPWQWWNITAKYKFIDGSYAPWRMLDLEFDSSIFMNCVIYLNSDGTRRIPRTDDNGPVGSGAANGYANAEYLIAVEGDENGQLGGAVTALAQVTADENGNIEIPDSIQAGDGEFLNLYGACRHPSAHLTGDGQYVCNICGESLPAVIDLGSKSEAAIGDVNLDGIISITDVTLIQRYIAEFEIFTDGQLAAADTDGSGEVDIDDVTLLQMFIAEYDVVLGKQPEA